MSTPSVTVVEGPYPVVRFGSLVLTLGRLGGGGYEMLVEVDTDEGAPKVPVQIGTAVGDEVEWDL